MAGRVPAPWCACATSPVNCWSTSTMTVREARLPRPPAWAAACPAWPNASAPTAASSAPAPASPRAGRSRHGCRWTMEAAHDPDPARRRSVPAPHGVPADPGSRTRHRGRRRGRGRGIRSQYDSSPAPRRRADGRPDAGHGRDTGDGGFMLKDAPPAELLTAIRTVAGGDAVLAPTATRRLIDQFAPLLPNPGRQPERDAVLSKLTSREQTVFTQLAAGRSNREIAAELHLSEGTVKIHVGRILTKLGLRDRVQAVVLAYESGLITPGS